MIASKANGANAKVIEGVAEPVPTARKARKQRAMTSGFRGMARRLNAGTGQRLSRSLLYLGYEMVALLESSPQRGLSAIRKTGMAHQKRFSHRWPPQSQRP